MTDVVLVQFGCRGQGAAARPSKAAAAKLNEHLGGHPGERLGALDAFKVKTQKRQWPLQMQYNNITRNTLAERPPQGLESEDKKLSGRGLGTSF